MVGRETGKPGVTEIVTGAGLACHLEILRQRRPGRTAGPFLNHLLHGPLGQESRAGIHHLVGIDRVAGQRLGFLVEHIGNGAQASAETAR